MTLDPDICYHALQSRDARFDGRFFTGVRTTGIYCRPVCPARTPKPDNVTFYPSAAAAEAAGFRPCMRCRPETSPGTPAWSGTAASVTRALRLIDDGFLDERSVDDLADALGMTSRHVRRLFDEHLGASPVAVAQARRVHFARRLVAETTLPITEIAFGAGFASVRRFNSVFQRTFGRPPSAFRREAPATKGAPAAKGTRPAKGTRATKRTPVAQNHRRDAGLALGLSARPPFDARQVLGFIAPRAMPGVENVESILGVNRRARTESGRVDTEYVRYRRVARFGDDTGVIEVIAAPGGKLELRVPSALAPHSLPAVERVRQLFDLKADPLAIADHLARDRMLSPLATRYPGVRIPGAWSPFETAVRAILGQQISVRGATTLAGRIVERYGERALANGPGDRMANDPGDRMANGPGDRMANGPGDRMANGPGDRMANGSRGGVSSNEAAGISRLFPPPERLMRARLENLGLTKARARAIRTLARAAADGALEPGADLGEILERLQSLDGIGPWTAHYMAMRIFGEPDAFPSGDLALRRAVEALDPSIDTERKLIVRAEAWRPWRAYATMLLWNWYMENEAVTRRRRNGKS